VESRARDVPSCKERTKADVHDRRASVGACRGKFADELRGLHELRRWQDLGNSRLTRLALHIS